MWEFIKDNPGICLVFLYVVAKIVVRVTPTKKDDAIFGPIEAIILRVWLKIPNKKKGGGTF